jgi:hypothetical protein
MAGIAGSDLDELLAFVRECCVAVPRDLLDGRIFERAWSVLAKPKGKQVMERLRQIVSLWMTHHCTRRAHYIVSTIDKAEERVLLFAPVDYRTAAET